MIDVVIRSGTIVDGTGADARQADLAISNGRIVAIGEVHTDVGVEVIDATGLVVAPGFIDVHSHSDLCYLVDPSAKSKIMQGVTTEIVGNCGRNLGIPYRSGNRRRGIEWSQHFGVSPDYVGLLPGEYVSALSQQGASVNVGFLVGHETVRSAVMGLERRAPMASELSEMKEMVREGLAAGALGMSTGLFYAPGAYCDREELISLVEPLQAAGGIYVTHLRDERAGRNRVEDALGEALEIGRRGGVPVHVSHLKIIGSRMPDAAGRLLSLMQDGRELGIRVSADVYPYVASCTELSAIVSQGSEIPLTGESALEAANRRRGEIRQAIDDRGGAKRLLVVGCPGDRGLEGMTLAAIAKRKHVDVEVIVDGLIEQGDAIVASHSMREEDLIVFLSDERTCIGTDGYAVSIDAGWNQASFHPRSFGAFPRYLARYVRELKTTTLEQAIHRMTGLPADVFGVQGRGRIAEGLAADLVIFDPDRIVDEATFEAPRAYPRGIEYVMVNGTWVVADGTATDETPGDVLERKTGG